MPLTTIDLLRHGEAEGGTYYRGITDDPLSENGWQQMHQAVASLPVPDIIISSPLQRCQAFASALSTQNHSTLLIDSGFKEFNFGSWEGKTANEISLNDPEALNRFYLEPDSCQPPGGDHPKDFQHRILSCWNHTIQQNREKHLLIITHAGVIRMLLSFILDIPLRNTFRIKLNYASLTRLQCFHSNPEPQYQLLFHNYGKHSELFKV